MSGDDRPVSEIGEQGLLRLLQAKLPRPPDGQIWSGDDAAVVDVAGRLVVTTDIIVEGIDFRLDTFSGADIGWKAMAINISDIAAMGARPRYAVATVTLPRDVTVELFEGIVDGVIEAAGAYEVALVGGDISEGAQLTIGGTVLGGASSTIARRGARVGDSVCVTGTLGGAAGGLVALDRGVDARELIARQRRPRPRVTEGLALSEVATAMIDISDGLAMDLAHIVEASEVGCDVHVDAIPVDPHLDALDVDGLELAVTGGEDFELLFTVPAVTSVPASVSFTEIGVITDGDAKIGDRPLGEWKERAWDHLRNR